jgi:phosphate starvation-inducible protein PhoH
MFINGDTAQSDIGNRTGLNDFINITRNVHGVGGVELGDDFQTRNKMIVKITKNYNNFLKKRLNVTT